MTAAADHDGAARVVQHLQTDLASLPHSALSAVLEHASRNFDVLEVRRTWSVLTKRFDPTSRDKTNFLRRTLELHNPEVADTQLRQFFGWVDHPDALSLLLTAHIAANDIPSARDVFDKLMAVRPSVTIVNKMLGMYAANVNADPAVELFDGMADFGLTPNIASYTSLIALFANTRDAENARNVFGLMEDSGIRPDASAYSAVLNAEVEAGEWLEAAKRWDGIPNHLQNVPDVVSVILKAYILLSIPTQRVIEIFRRIERPTSYLWSLAMQSAVDNDEIPLAYQLLSEMDDAAAASSRAPQPSVYHFSILLHGYMRTGRRREARETYDDMLERGIIPSSVTYGMIMGAFKKIEGSSGLEQATQFAESLDTTAWHIRGAARGRAAARENMYGPLVSMSGASGQLGRAEEYLELAAEEPTLPLYTRLMDAYRQAGRTDSVMAIWEKAFELACVTSRQTASDLLGGKPTSRARDNLLCMPLSIVLDALASAGRYLDVRRVWDSVQKAGFGFDAQNYNHYATALARTGDVDRAFSIVENILLPRWEEIKKRRVVAMRETAFGLLPPPEEAPAVEDVPTSPPARTNNRRHEERYSVGALLTDPSRARGSIDSGVLRHWRPSDVLWRPSLLTLSVLEHAYSQLQDLNRGAWMALGGSEEDADAEEGAGEVALPRFGGAPIRDVDGEVKKTTPRAVLFRLNRKYTKVVALVMFHRRQRSAKKSS
ncbi:uncharacterized protein MKK02DRAFT_23011 [Dioszegia hungarica]|uniref:Pentacotripeptide-repeat region of PRORP domain-containing protein n=1 Tax=Dioszegia hungarica TaxID=4972 RepID=A0AA38LXB7_9TREE|nr:uncharacterized protein MKK02DRAFT_23011 [Dioszegia hungarica]KAI9637814.1 hypothetical protein MKK02DRAFT_23011 [Dioszegia hungarica]